MNEFLVVERDHPSGMGGVQKVYRFPNNYGASVIRTPFSYGGDAGQWELGVLKFDSKGKWRLTYDTHITSDVLGRLSEAKVKATLKQIKELPND